MTYDKNENDRASRIALRVNEYHLLMAKVYENLVDRDFDSVEKDCKTLIMELRFLIKSTKDDDF
jgi:hypothetical protein